jgi:predicted ATPase/DNA-binding SARP family transcriptional activator
LLHVTTAILSVSDAVAGPLVIRLFGPFEVRLHDAPLPPLRSQKACWLLALLALRAGAGVDRDWLAATLWPDSPEAAALANVRSNLRDLRLAFGPQAARLLTPTKRTIGLDVMGADVDALAFDAAIARGDPASIERAVALYRGPLLEGCAEVWAFEARQAREHAYLAALERLAERALARGERATAERYLRRAVATDPLREAAQRALMQALAGGGSYSAALQVYLDLRVLLHRELSAEPDPETRALFASLRERARLGRRSTTDPAGRAPAPPPVRGAGSVPTRPPTTATSRDAEERRHNLPVQRTPLIGREAEVAAAAELVRRDDVGLVTFTGPGGTGKTRLALQVAAELAEEFSDGVFLVSLAPISDPERVVDAISQTLGVLESGNRPLMASLKEHLRPRRLLLLLDNFEQILSAAPVVAELLAAAPGLKVLVTSRAILRLREEREFPVPPLALPAIANGRAARPSATLSAEGALASASVRLFVDRAEAATTSFTLTDESAPAVAEICRRLDGLPLAIELAAGRIRLFSPQGLLARLVDATPAPSLRLLSDGPRDLPARQQTLRDTIAWSYGLLGEAEQVFFRRLAVFVGGFTGADVAAVCGEDALAGIASLVDQNLLSVEETGEEEPRFGMLETIREFAREQLEASGEAGAVRDRHARHFSTLAEEAEVEIRDAEPTLGMVSPLQRLAEMEREHDNLRAALDHLGEHDPPAGLRLAVALAPFWFHRRHLVEGQQRLLALLARANGQEGSEARLRALREAGRIAWERSDWETARSLFEESLALAREVQDRTGMAWDLRFLAMTTVSQLGDLDASRALHEQSLALFEELGALDGVAANLGSLGIQAFARGDCAAGRAYWERFLAIQQERGDRNEAARAYERLTRMASEQGDYPAACRTMRARISLLRELADQQGISVPRNCRWTGDRTDPSCVALAGNERIEARRRADGIAVRRLWEEDHGIARALAGGEESRMHRDLLSKLALEQGELEAARAVFEENLAGARSQEHMAGAVEWLRCLAWIDLSRGEYGKARRLLEEAVSRARAVDRVWGLDSARVELGLVASDQGDFETAQGLLEASVDTYRERDLRAQLAAALCHLGTLNRRRGDLVAARPLLEESLALQRGMGAGRASLALALQAMGQLLLAEGDPAAAREPLREGLSIYDLRCAPLGVAACLEGLAVVQVEIGCRERAARWFGAAAAIRERLGTPIPSVDRGEYERRLAGAPAVLGDPDKAITEALGERHFGP